MTTAQILREARDLISDPARWSCGDRNLLSGLCAIEATDKVAGRYTRSPSDPVYRLLREAMAGTPPGLFNDSHTHAEVLAAFGRAIESAEAGE